MADDRIRRRGQAPERLDYRQRLEWIQNFIDNELGNGRAPRPRPDDTEWKTQRAKTIQKLKGLKEKLDNVCVNANYGKAAGNGAGILGAGAAIIGALLSLKGVPSSSFIMDSGNLVRHTGELVNGVSSIAESLFSAKYLNEIEAALKADQELSQPLADWLDFSRELDANIVALFGVSLSSKKWEPTMKVCNEFLKSFSAARGFEATLGLMKQGRYSVYLEDDEIFASLQRFFSHLASSPEFNQKMKFILSLLSHSFTAFRVYGCGVRIYDSFMGIPGSSVVPSLKGGLNPDIPTVREVSFFCAFNAINMAIDVVSFINAKNIIKNGKSLYSDAIEQLIRSLDGELKLMMDL